MLREKKKRKTNSKPSAMAQVHNRVNAGVMDAVAYGGGVMEAAEPEDDEYQLAMEPGGPSNYAHATDGKKTMYITEDQLRQIKLLLEGDDRIKKVNKIMDAEFGNLLNLDGPVRGEEYYVNNNPDTTWRQYILFSLRHTFGLMSNADVQYLPVVARLAFSDEVGFEKRNNNGAEVSKLMKMVNLFKTDRKLFEEVKMNPNVTFGELCEKLDSIFKEMDAADMEAANNVQARSDYEIKEVPDFQTAQYYGNSSCSKSKLCYTQRPDTWEKYTAKGANKVYVCLKRGWKEIPEEPGEGNPYDEYGTSMIFVFIDPDGEITTSNCRWNHHTEGQYNGSVDHAFTKATLCQTVGVNFNDVFKPYSEDELESRGVMTLYNVQKALDNGASLNQVFDFVDYSYEGENFVAVRLDNKWNFVTDVDGNGHWKILSPKWFSYVDDNIYNGLVVVGDFDRRYNYMNENGQLISQQWFDDAWPFRRGFGVVELNNQWNYIRPDGTILSDIWFDDCKYFQNDGLATVIKFADKTQYNVENLIDTSGNLISAEWFDSVGCQQTPYGFVRIIARRDKKTGELEYCLLTKEGKLPSMWFDYLFYLPSSGMFQVKKDGQYNYISATGKLLSDVWFDRLEKFYNGWAKVQMLNKGENFINTQGELLSDIWFNYFENDFSCAARGLLLGEMTNGKWNALDLTGNLIFRESLNSLPDLYAACKEYLAVYGPLPFTSFVNTMALEESKDDGLLLENEGTNIKKARNYLKAKGYNEEQRQQILVAVRNDIPNSRLGECKFILGVTRMYLDGELFDAQTISELNKTLKYIASEAHINEYDYNLNGESVQVLIDRFKGTAQADLQSSMEASNKRTLTINENYRIIPIDSFQEAQKYSDYTVTNDSKTHWCLTHMRDMFESYTNNGINRIYFCLRDGFENEKPIPGEGCPLDNYGLSMLSVIVDTEGALAYCTCRWNHAYGGSDNALTLEQLEDVLGRNFYQTFKPFSREELRAKGVIMFDELQDVINERLKNGERLWKIVNDLFTTWIGEGNPEDYEESEDDDNNYIFPERLPNGYYKVHLRGKHNLITPDGKIVFDPWFDLMSSFETVHKIKNGWFDNWNYTQISSVELNGKYNVMDSFGNLLWPEWRNDFGRLDYGGFKEGGYRDGERFVGFCLTKVYKDFIEDGKKITKENLMRLDGSLLTGEWYHDVSGPLADGLYQVTIHTLNEKGGFDYGGPRKINLLSVKTGKLISDQWYDEINGSVWLSRNDGEVFKDGFCVVTLDNPVRTALNVVVSNKQSNYMDINGEILSNQWFDGASSFSHGYGVVRMGKKENLVDTNGNIVLKQWFDIVYPFSHEGFTPVMLNGKWNVINKNSEFICSRWYDDFVDDYDWRYNEKYWATGVEFKIYDESSKSHYVQLKYQDGKMVEVDNQRGRGYLFESTDCVSFGFDCLDCYDMSAVPFISFVRNDGTKTKMFVGENGELHSSMPSALLSNGSIKKEEFGSIWNIKRDEERSGRVWILDDRTVISFYSYSKDPKKIYNACIEALLAVEEKTGADFNLGEVMVDWWTLNAHNIVIMPVRWFNNGVAEVYAPYVKSCIPEMSFTGEFEYVLKTTKGTFKLDWHGDELERESFSYSLNESMERGFDYNKYIKSFIDFLDEQHMKIRPLPEIELKNDEQDGLFIKTGYYSPDEMKVVAYVNDRHPKDVMRTIAHEFVHHMQNLQDPNKDWSSGGDLEEDSKLRAIEGEAFLLGNILFREWTEKMKRAGLNEGKCRIIRNDEGEVVPEKCDKCGGKVVCQIHGEPVYVCKDCGKYFGTVPCHLNEITELVEPDDVDLSSFNIKKHLNPKFWEDGHLDTRIRLKLLDIADDFFNSLGVDWVEPEDVIMTGSLANYNWNERFSDIDLHILVDYEDVDERTDFVKEYFTMKKNQWNQKHARLKIFGFPVEVYVQDVNEPHASSGVYSVDKDKWLTEPDLDNLRSGHVDKKHVREMVSTYMNKIDALIDIYKTHKDDEYEMEKVYEDASEMLDEIKELRRGDLKKFGKEMCDGNVIFKALRRSDYIGKLIKLKDLAYDKINSL